MLALEPNLRVLMIDYLNTLKCDRLDGSDPTPATRGAPICVSSRRTIYCDCKPIHTTSAANLGRGDH